MSFLFLKRGFWFVIDNWRVFIIPAIVVVLLTAALCIRFCGRKPATLDHKATIEAMQAIEDNDREKMVEILVKSDLELKEIDANVAEGRLGVLEAAHESRQEHSGKSNNELAAELGRRARQ